LTSNDFHRLLGGNSTHHRSDIVQFGIGISSQQFVTNIFSVRVGMHQVGKTSRHHVLGFYLFTTGARECYCQENCKETVAHLVYPGGCSRMLCKEYCGETAAHLKKVFLNVTLSDFNHFFLSQNEKEQKASFKAPLPTIIKMSRFSLLLLALFAIIATSTVSAADKNKSARLRKLQTLSPVAIAVMTPVATPTTSSSGSSGGSSSKSGKGGSSKSSKRQLVNYNTEYEK
jgi:hypothetical protein